MNSNLLVILKSIEDSAIFVEMAYPDDDWYSSISSLSGWYIIKTNTPVDALGKVGNPNPEAKAHINIPKTISEIKKVLPQGLVIKQEDNKPYTVYNGRAKNLKARAREHYNGHNKTFCLALKKYPMLWAYKWYFYYYPITKLGLNDIDNKMFLIIVEQAWRAKHGWPVLCKQ